MNEKTPAFSPSAIWLPPAVWAELARFSAILMDIILLSSWFEQIASPPVSFAVIMATFAAIVVISHIIPRRLAAHPRSPNQKRWIFAAWWLVAILAALQLLAYPAQGIDIGKLLYSPFASFIRPGGNILEIWIVVFAIILISRGVTIGSAFASGSQLYTQFTISSIFMMIYTFVAGFQHPVQVTMMITAYFFFALLSLAAYRIVNAKATFGTHAPDYTVRWSSAILVYLLLLGSSGFLIGGIIYIFIPWFINLIYPFLRIFILSIGILIGLLINLVVTALQEALRALSNLGIFQPASEFFKKIEEFSKQTQNWQNENMTNMGTPFNMVLFIIFILIILTIIFIIMARRMNRLRKIRLQQSKMINLNLENAEIPRGRGSRRKLRASARSQAAQRIRQIYSDLMLLFDKLETPRPEAFTPQEFLPKMTAVLPDRNDDLELITRAYQDVRYGELPETEEEVEAIAAAWKRIQLEGKHAAKKKN